MRCKCCDKIMDRIYTFEVDGVEVMEELCSECREASEDEYSYLDHEFMFENLREGALPPCKTEE